MSEALLSPPKNLERKNPLENISLNFSGSRRHRPHSLSSKGPHYRPKVLFISAGAIEGHFEGNAQREFHHGVPVLAQNAPAHRAIAT